MYTNDELIDYLLSENVNLMPIYNKKPAKKASSVDGSKKFTEMRNYDWIQYLKLNDKKEYAEYLKNYIKAPTHGFSVVLFNDFIVVDFDPGHQGDGVLSPIEQRRSLMKILNHQRTIYAYKKNSMNLHLFYRNTGDISVNSVGWLKKQNISCDVFSYNRHTRVIPDYYFKNIDLNKGFLEQMGDCPKSIIDYAKARERKLIKNAQYVQKHNYRQVASNESDQWMLNTINRWAYQNKFAVGEQNTNIFKFALLALRHDINEDEVRMFLHSFVQSCIPDMDCVVDNCVNSAMKYI